MNNNINSNSAQSAASSLLIGNTSNSKSKNNNNKEGVKGGVNGVRVKSTVCKPISLSNCDWNITIPDHPIPPLNLPIHPLALLIGWINASPKHLERYIKLYRDAGFCTLSLIPSSTLHFLFPKMKELALNLTEYLYQQMLKTPRSIIIQVFSGNLVFLSEIYNLLKNNEKYKILIPLIKGQIFDSCPSSISEAVAYQTMIESTRPGLPLKMALKLACRTYTKVVDVDALNRDFWNRLSNCPILSPQLFIYSIDDPITSYMDVQKGIEVMKQQGIPVTVLCFDKSKHVNHLGTHTMKYLKYLYHFLDSNLRPISSTINPLISTQGNNGTNTGSNLKQSIKNLLVSKL